MADEKDDKVENFNPNKSMIENAFTKLFTQRKKDKKTEIEKQAKVAADAYNIFRTEITKLKEMEEDFKALDDDKTTLVDLGID